MQPYAYGARCRSARSDKVQRAHALNAIAMIACVDGMVPAGAHGQNTKTGRNRGKIARRLSTPDLHVSAARPASFSTRRGLATRAIVKIGSELRVLWGWDGTHQLQCCSLTILYTNKVFIRFNELAPASALSE